MVCVLFDVSGLTSTLSNLVGFLRVCFANDSMTSRVVDLFIADTEQFP